MMDELTYQAGINLLRERDPDSIWIPELKRLGFTLMSTKYLEKELQRLDAEQSSLQRSSLQGVRGQKSKSSQQQSSLQGVRGQKSLARDPILNDLYNNRTKLYNLRGKTSNKFHQCSDDADRAAVSTDVQGIQARIKTVTITIRQYEETGQLPQSAEKYPVPRAGLERHRLLLRLRSQISNKKTHLKDLFKLSDEVEKKQHRITKAEAKLQELETHKAYVEKAIKRTDKKGR